ncbi:hypothetical protein DM992_22300 [Burkholderia sp. JP2-270]|nr:hypothetical protein DM992_22300 [Burkholderia sp. JP2-270]
MLLHAAIQKARRLVVRPGSGSVLFMNDDVHAEFMKRQPAYISTQLHRALGDSPTYLNYAIRESTQGWCRARRSRTRSSPQKMLASLWISCAPQR